MGNINEMGYDPKLYDEIVKQFEKLKFDAGIEPDENYQKELESILGIDFDDLDEQLDLNAKSRLVEV